MDLLGADRDRLRDWRFRDHAPHPLGLSYLRLQDRLSDRRSTRRLCEQIRWCLGDGSILGDRPLECIFGRGRCFSSDLCRSRRRYRERQAGANEHCGHQGNNAGPSPGQTGRQNRDQPALELRPLGHGQGRRRYGCRPDPGNETEQQVGVFGGARSGLEDPVVRRALTLRS